MSTERMSMPSEGSCRGDAGAVSRLPPLHRVTTTPARRAMRSDPAMRSAQCHLHGRSLRAPAASRCLMPHSAYALTGRIPAYMRFFIGGADEQGPATPSGCGRPFLPGSPLPLSHSRWCIRAPEGACDKALGRPGLPYPPPSLSRMVRCCMYNAWPATQSVPVSSKANPT